MVGAKFASFFGKYPVSRGMVAYSILWPTSELCRQFSDIKSDNKQRFQATFFLTYPKNIYPPSLMAWFDVYCRSELDYSRAVRFSLYGTLWVAPTVFMWVKFIGRIIPGNSLPIAMVKAIVDQAVWAPFTISTFYWGMARLEGRSNKEAIDEVKTKFIPTWKVFHHSWLFNLNLTFLFMVVNLVFRQQLLFGQSSRLSTLVLYVKETE